MKINIDHEMKIFSFKVLKPLAVLCITINTPLITPVIAQDVESVTTAENGSQATQDRIARSWRAAVAAARTGPAEIELRNIAKLKLAPKYMFIPLAQASDFMQALGNRIDERFVGMIAPVAGQDYWFITVDYNDSGHIKDDDAKNWDTDSLLKSIKEGTEADNVQREKMGIPPLDIIGWVQPPTYDAKDHRLVWSIKARPRGLDPSTPLTINYNTYALGRTGYFELDLVTDETMIASNKQDANQIVDAVQFNLLQGYQDFDETTDKVAGYGLAALITGVAAKKLGLFALIAAFAAKAWKLGLVVLIAVGAGIRKLLARRGEA